MQIDLYCPHCACRFGAEADTPAQDILERMADHGPWYSLGDGETFEDMIHAALTARGVIRCPVCGKAVQVSEKSLGEFTQKVLANW